MTDFKPIVTTLSEVRDGDLHVYRRPDGTWSDPYGRLAREPGDHGRLPAVILDRAHPWPDAPVIRVLSGTVGGEEIPPGTLAVRGLTSILGSSYVLSTGWGVSEGSKDDSITKWEALTPVPHEALRTLLDAVRGMHLDPDEETLLRSAWSVLDEAEREARYCYQAYREWPETWSLKIDDGQHTGWRTVTQYEYDHCLPTGHYPDCTKKETP